VPAHIVYRDGKRVLITDPREIKDPLSDALIALAKDVEGLRSRLDKLAHLEAVAAPVAEVESCAVGGLATEDKERCDYRSEFDKSNFADYGAGI
jgi:serine O-acetyltransferase